MKADEPASLESISKVAEQRRNEIRQSVESLKTPDFLLEIMQTEVSYILNPRVLPYDYVALDQFDKQLRSLYGLERDTSEVSTPYPSNPLQALLSRDEIRSARLTYINGKFPLSKKEFIPIKSVILTSERVHIILKGDSRFAEALLADITEALWISTGTNKQWETIKPNLQLIGYGTATKVKLDVTLESFLHPDLTSFIKSECLTGKRYAADMGMLSSRTRFHASDTTICTYAVDDLIFRFSLFNPLTGRSEACSLKFSVTNNDEYGTGIYTVVSEMPYEKHIQMIADLAGSFRSAPKG